MSENLHNSDAAAWLKRVQRFTTKYIDSDAKAELLRLLTYQPSQFQTLEEILASSRSSSVDIERAIFALRNAGLVQVKEGPRGTSVALAHDSIARKLAPALWKYLKEKSLDFRQKEAAGTSD